MNCPDQVRIAILGGGARAEFALLPALERVPDARVTLLVDTDAAGGSYSRQDFTSITLAITPKSATIYLMLQLLHYPTCCMRLLASNCCVNARLSWWSARRRSQLLNVTP